MGFCDSCFWLPSSSRLDTAADSGTILSSTFSIQQSSSPVQGCWDKSPGHSWESGLADSHNAPFEGNERWGQRPMVIIYLKGPSFLVYIHSVCMPRSQAYFCSQIMFWSSQRDCLRSWLQQASWRSIKYIRYWLTAGPWGHCRNSVEVPRGSTGKCHNCSKLKCSNSSVLIWWEFPSCGKVGL